jgi:hypothetical protein
MGQSAETARVTSICCAAWRIKPQHDDCPGVTLLGNLGPLVRCACEECKDRPNHKPEPDH